MATEKELRQAKIVFDTLCEMMDNNNWKYDAVEEDLMIDALINLVDNAIKASEQGSEVILEAS